LRLEEIGDDLDRAIGARKEHRFGGREGRRRWQHCKHQEHDKLKRSVSHLRSISNISDGQCKDGIAVRYVGFSD
jgi:hypothetical protein